MREGVAPQGQAAGVPAALLDASALCNLPSRGMLVQGRTGGGGVAYWWWWCAGHQYDMFVRITGDGSMSFSQRHSCPPLWQVGQQPTASRKITLRRVGHDLDPSLGWKSVFRCSGRCVSTISLLLAANGSPSSKGERILMMRFQIIWRCFELEFVAGGRNVLGGLRLAKLSWLG